MDSIMPSFIVEGGPFMYVILLLGIVACALFFERLVAFKFEFKLNHNFFTKVRFLVKDGRIDEAYRKCLSKPHPLSKVLVVLLKNSNRNPEEIESLGSIEIQKVIPSIQKRTNYINMLGNVATLVGLLGTVQGLVLSFSSLAGADPAKKAELLANGISTAMYTTAFGLIVAIPCIVAFTYLTNEEEDLLKGYDEITSDVMHSLIYNKGEKEHVKKAS